MQALTRQFVVLCSLIILVATLSAADPLQGRDPVDDVFYHFMPIAWRDSDSDTYRYGDFGGMTDSLDYLEELGVTAVWMNPIFPTPAYHGYQHGPGDQVNPWFGSEADFLDFIAEAHARGIKVFIDFVVYGVNRDYGPWFADAYNNPSSQYDDWLAFTNSANTSYQGSTYTTWSGATVRHIWWNLNTQEPFDLVTGWSEHWLDPDGDGDPNDGLDGYRLDHVWANYPTGPNGWGYNMDDFWVPWKQALLAVNPDVFTFAEQADWGSHGTDLMPAHDASMTKPFEFAARDALANEYAAPLYSQMDTTVAVLPANKLFVATIGDHDVSRLATEIGGSFEKGKAAAAVLMTQPFPPIVYYGDEIGMRGQKTGCSGDTTDIGMREPFKWNAVAGPPMTNYWARNGCALSNAYSSNNDGRSVEEQLGSPGSLLEEYKLLIETRKTHVALRRGSYHSVPASSTAVWGFLRHVADQETLLVAINVSGTQRSFVLDLSNVTIPGGSTSVQDVISGATLTNLTTANQSAYPVTLPAYYYLILAVNVVPNAPEPQTIDGLDIPADVGPGAVRATQNNATAMGDNVNELDQMFVRVDSDALIVGLTGNLNTDGTGLALFLDTVTGGQNPLDTASFNEPPSGIPQIDGMVLDSGFVPDYILFVNAYSGTVYVDLYELNSGGGGTKRFIGSGTVNDLDGFLTGADNPNGMLVALNNGNTAGVTASSTVGASTATSGFEMSLPFADLSIASPQGTIRMMAMLLHSDGNVGNQFLPGLGGGYGYLGYVPIDLNSIPGSQNVAIALERIPGDWDGDGDVDMQDADAFLNCFSGPDDTALGPGCSLFDFDFDLDVDMADFTDFQRLFEP